MPVDCFVLASARMVYTRTTVGAGVSRGDITEFLSATSLDKRHKLCHPSHICRSGSEPERQHPTKTPEATAKKGAEHDRP